MELKKNSTSFLLFQITAIMLCIIGITFAISYIMKSINVNLKTAPLAVDYTGSLTLPTVNLFPIEDSTVKTNTDNVLRVNFTVKGASSNPDIPIIYDVILSDLKVDKELKNKYFKWELEKNGVVISSGSLDPWFDRITNGKFWLTEIQQDLPKNNQTADNYEFRLWISESCSGDVTTCTEEMDQSNMLNKSISGKIETVLYTKGKKALVRKPGYNGADYVESIFPNNKDTMNNDDPDGNIRYMGVNPNNYVKFNDELWRIIGVFDVAKEEGGKTEKRLKIIRDESIGYYSWDNKPSGTGSSVSDNGSNDWTDSALMEVLNSGPYWNRTSGNCPYSGNGITTSCDFSSLGLTNDSKKLIDKAVWNIGGHLANRGLPNGLVNNFYINERGTNVYEGRKTTWIGTVGLMYPSDYGYATSGGQIKNRNLCLTKDLLSWDLDEYSDCKNNDYLYDPNSYQWTITPSSESSDFTYFVKDNGYIGTYTVRFSNLSVSPVLYLKSNTLFTKGTGSKDNPFELDIDKEETTLPTGAEYIESLLESNPNTMNNDDPDGNVRYMGKKPNNYVRFNNNELWRIIGVFNVKSSASGQPEKRLKIIKDEPLGNMAWDSGNKNDWTKASSQIYLNGEYYNSLTSESKSLVGDTYWNIGGTANYTSASNGLASHFYGYERGTTTYGGQPSTWVGKIGLMYPSDYGYATSGGTTTIRTSCLTKELYNWDSSSYSDCKNNDYLYDSSNFQWMITSYSSDSDIVFYVSTSGSVYRYDANDTGNSVSPVLYLKSDVIITGGTGTSTDPYTLG